SFPRFADSPGATLCRPLRGLVSLLVIFPPVRGLTGGYTLSPAGRARVFVGHLSPGSRTHRRLHSVARCAGSCLSPGSRTHLGIAFCRPLRGLSVATAGLFLREAGRGRQPWTLICNPLRGCDSGLRTQDSELRTQNSGL